VCRLRGLICEVLYLGVCRCRGGCVQGVQRLCAWRVLQKRKTRIIKQTSAHHPYLCTIKTVFITHQHRAQLPMWPANHPPLGPIPCHHCHHRHHHLLLLQVLRVCWHCRCHHLHCCLPVSPLQCLFGRAKGSSKGVISEQTGTDDELRRFECFQQASQLKSAVPAERKQPTAMTNNAPAITASTLNAFLSVSFSTPSSAAAVNAKRQLVELMMVLEVTLVNASDLWFGLMVWGGEGRGWAVLAADCRQKKVNEPPQRSPRSSSHTQCTASTCLCCSHQAKQSCARNHAGPTANAALIKVPLDSCCCAFIGDPAASTTARSSSNGTAAAAAAVAEERLLSTPPGTCSRRHRCRNQRVDFTTGMYKVNREVHM